jgi:integrase
MSVYRRQGSDFWHYDFVLKGRRFHGSTGQKGRRAAETVERKMREDAALGRLNDASRLTLDLAVGRWFTEVGSGRKDSVRTRPQSPSKLETRLANLLWSLGKDVRLAEINQATVAAAIERRRGMAFSRSASEDAKSYLPSNATVNRDIIDSLRPILGRAATHWGAEGLSQIDWRSLRLPEPRETVRVYADDEQTRWIKEAAKTGWYRGETATERAADVSLALELMLTYGLRFSELFFPPGAYDPTGPRIAWAKGRKGDVPMVVPLLERHAAAVALRVGRAQAAGLKGIWYYEPKPGKLVEITKAGLEHRLSNAADRAKVPAGRRIHGARHHAGTMMYRQTEDMKAVQRLLGHSDLKSTNRYVHAGEAQLRAALEARDKSRHSPAAPTQRKRKVKQK